MTIADGPATMWKPAPTTAPTAVPLTVVQRHGCCMNVTEAGAGPSGAEDEAAIRTEVGAESPSFCAQIARSSPTVRSRWRTSCGTG